MPFLRIIIPYLSGLTAGYYGFRTETFRMLLYTSVILVILLFIGYIGRPFRYGRLWITGVLASLVFFLLGTLNILSRELIKERFSIKESELTAAKLLIVDTPEINPINVRTIARMLERNGTPQRVQIKTKVMVFFTRTGLSEALKSGDIIEIQSRFLPIPGPANKGEFDYRAYLSRQDIDYQVFAGSNNWKFAGGTRRNLKIYAILCRDRLLDCYRSSPMESRLVALLSALTLGYKTDLEAETTELFTKAGVVHVMALSGFNVGIIFLLINYCLGFMRKRGITGIIRLLVSLVAIWMFAIVTGLSSSVTRASVMISLFLIGKHIHRDVHPLNVISASAFLMLVISPFSLFDVGFQLSYAAVLGIVYMQPVFHKIITVKNRLGDKIWILFTVSVAAQLATAPLTLYYFHQFPLFFWITNLYVVPLVTLIIYLSVPFVILSFITPVKNFLARILEFLMKAIIGPLDRLADFPGAVMEGIFINQIQVILLLILLVGMGMYIRHHRAGYIIVSLSAMLAFIFTDTFRLYSTNRQQYLTVNCIRGTSIMNIISGKNNLVLSFSEKMPTEKMLHYSFYNWWVERHVCRTVDIFTRKRMNEAKGFDLPSISIQNAVLGNNIFLNYSGVSLVVCTDDVFEHFNSPNKLRTDYVVVTDNIRPGISKLSKHFDVGSIIIDSSVGYYESKKWTALCELNKINCWPVREKGAFMLKVK
ncbi:MAG: ComEC family competence protein [Bacteroidales bacterium]|nr:ComEC family competence protein [Bacteroidales bacterium]